MMTTYTRLVVLLLEIKLFGFTTGNLCVVLTYTTICLNKMWVVFANETEKIEKCYLFRENVILML